MIFFRSQKNKKLAYARKNDLSRTFSSIVLLRLRLVQFIVIHAYRNGLINYEKDNTDKNN